jgi:hypothetical protein
LAKEPQKDGLQKMKRRQGKTTPPPADEMPVVVEEDT